MAVLNANTHIVGRFFFKVVIVYFFPVLYL